MPTWRPYSWKKKFCSQYETKAPRLAQFVQQSHGIERRHQQAAQELLDFVFSTLPGMQDLHKGSLSHSRAWSARGTPWIPFDLLISEEAQQDMDLKSAFAPAVPRRAFFRQLLGDPRQSPGGVATDRRAHRTLLKAPIGLRAPNTWSCHMSSQGLSDAPPPRSRLRITELEEAAIAVSRGPLGSCWFRPDKVKAESPFAKQLQSTYGDLSSIDLDLRAGLLVGLGCAATCPDSPLDFRQAQSAAERLGVASPHCWSLMLPTSARVAQEVYEPLTGIQYSMLCSRIRRHLANRHHIHTGKSFDCVWTTFRPVAPCLAQYRCKEGAQEQPHCKGPPAPS